MSASPIDTVVRYFETLPDGQTPRRLVDALDRFPDPRGVRRKVGTVLAVLVCAALAGARSVLAAWDWATQHSAEFAADGLNVPSYDCLRRTAARIDAEELDKVFGSWALALVAGGPDGGPVVLAADGKELRGAKNGGGQVTRLLAACDHATGVVVGQVGVGAKTDEIPKVKDLPGQVGDVSGMVFALDGPTPRDKTAELVVCRGADYPFAVKADRPGLLASRLAHPWNRAGSHRPRSRAAAGCRPGPRKPRPRADGSASPAWRKSPGSSAAAKRPEPRAPKPAAWSRRSARIGPGQPK